MRKANASGEEEMSYQQRRRKPHQYQIHLPGKASDPNMNRCRFCTNMQDMDNGEGGMECKLPEDQRDKNRKCFSAPDEIS
jgi:hypothetical protein